MTATTVVHPAYVCPACEGTDAQLYHFGRDNGAAAEVAHGCEHFIRECYQDDPPPAGWLAERAVAPGAPCMADAAVPSASVYIIASQEDISHRLDGAHLIRLAELSGLTGPGAGRIAEAVTDMANLVRHDLDGPHSMVPGAGQAASTVPTGERTAPLTETASTERAKAAIDRAVEDGRLIRRDDGTLIEAAHYHVMAVQDWGGRCESWRGWDEKQTLAEAEQLARDAIEADRSNREPWTDDVLTWDELEAKFKPKYGDTWTDLYSDNINPGWEAIFIRPCAHAGECDLWRDISSRYDRGYPEPWWTPSRGERNPELIPIP